MKPTPTQPFHTDHDPDLGALVDDFLVEMDRILRPPLERKPRRDKKAGKP